MIRMREKKSGRRESEQSKKCEKYLAKKKIKEIVDKKEDKTKVLFRFSLPPS